MTVTKERIEGLECPRCGKDYDELMNQPAMVKFGYNPQSGLLYRCSACHSRITEYELETGNELSMLIESDEEFETEWPT